MLGLMIKDLYVLRRMAKSYVAVIVIYGAMVLGGIWSAEFFAGIIMVLVIMLPINVFSWDHSARWEGYCMALPVSRRQMVAARYLVAALTMAAASVLALLLCIGLMAMGQGGEIGEYAVASVGSLLGGCLLNAVMLPILYKVGPEKGRLAMMGVFGVVLAAVFLVARWGAFDALEGASAGALLAGFAVFVVALMAASFLLSCRIYERKEA